MPLSPTLGSQSLPAHLQRAGTRLRADIHRHGTELATGKTIDPARHLRGDIGALAVIDTRLSRITAQEFALKSATLKVDAAQTALNRVTIAGETIRDRLITVASGEASGEMLTMTGLSARSELATIISALSAQSAGQSVFSGASSDRGPLPDAQTLLAAVVAHLAGAPDATAIVAGVDDFFNMPGGQFETVIYAGSAAVTFAALAPEITAPALPTAADPAIRAALREAVLAALLAEPAASSDLGTRRALAVLATGRYPQTAEALVGLRATIGDSQAALEVGRSRLSSERDMLILSRDGLIGIDPYEAASRLEETRARLEALYAVTARVARLSLTEYLR